MLDRTVRMGRRQKLRLGDVLVQQNVLTAEQLTEALAGQRGTGKKLGEYLIDSGKVSERDIAEALSTQLGLELVDLTGADITKEFISQVTPAVARRYQAIPYRISENNANVLYLAMADPMDMMAMDDFGIMTNMQIEAVVATTTDIMKAIDRLYGASEITTAADKYAKEKEEEAAALAMEESTVNEDVENSPIVLMVKGIIEQAVRQGASDIHIEPMESQVRVRYRIDGALYERVTYSPRLLGAIVARIKIIGGMDISEKRKPQDGRITQIVDRQEFDIRVSILPTVYGEKVVMRLTSKKGLTKPKSALGLSVEETKRFDHIFGNPHGIILVTGPTGSGKSTTLYTALSELNSEFVNIITVEDPVEANINGINQVHVNAKAGLSFASALRSILRQDPDIIMIGEIRDGETAGIAVQASITGHLVVSTLHTNSAAGSIGRLIDMGIEPYLLADSIVGIIAQRLVRRLCLTCREQYSPDDDEREILGYPSFKEESEKIAKGEMDAPIKLYRHKNGGCPQCSSTGFKGRIGVYEILQVSPKVKHAISKQMSAEEIKEIAIDEGMNTLRMSASKLVKEGITEFSEMIKVSFDN